MGLISLHGKTLRVLYLEGLTTMDRFDPTYLHLVNVRHSGRDQGVHRGFLARIPAVAD